MLVEELVDIEVLVDVDVGVEVEVSVVVVLFGSEKRNTVYENKTTPRCVK